jgi:hypothetical protein
MTWEGHRLLRRDSPSLEIETAVGIFTWAVSNTAGSNRFKDVSHTLYSRAAHASVTSEVELWLLVISKESLPESP